MDKKIVKMPDTEEIFYRRIGSTNFKVRVLFSESATETMEEKILRNIRNLGDHFYEKCDMNYMLAKRALFSQGPLSLQILQPFILFRSSSRTSRTASRR